jgi:hypothetical protein
MATTLGRKALLNLELVVSYGMLLFIVSCNYVYRINKVGGELANLASHLKPPCDYVGVRSTDNKNDQILGPCLVQQEKHLAWGLTPKIQPPRLAHVSCVPAVANTNIGTMTPEEGLG